MRLASWRAVAPTCAAATIMGWALLAPLAALAGQDVDMDRELHLMLMGQMPPRHIAGAEFRVAVFTYDDPHGTGLGNDLAAIVARHVLLRSGVSSIGVIAYEGSYERTIDLPLSYFDKVEKITEAQQVSLAIWGMVQRLGDELVIDTFVQIPRLAQETYFTWRLRLPERMGSGALTARLRPDRIHVQRLRSPVEDAGVFVDAAASLRRLLAEPIPGAEVTAEIPRGQIYYITDRRDDWVYIKSRGLEGWAPLESHCLEWCDKLLDAGGFAGDILAHMARPDSRPRARPGLTVEALAIEEQLEALEGLNAGRPEEISETTLALTDHWIGPGRLTGFDDGRQISRGAGLPPGGAAFANIRAVGRIALALQEGFRSLGPVPEEDTVDAFNYVRLDPVAVAEVAFDLAEASLDDPRNTDILHNLAILFDYIGDGERAALARSLGEEHDAGSE